MLVTPFFPRCLIPICRQVLVFFIHDAIAIYSLLRTTCFDNINICAEQSIFDQNSYSIDPQGT